jgi:uncharacterized protein YmfQ (DUF2313 family)
LWEQLLSIPDDCIKTNVSDNQRRVDIIIKLGYLNLQTEQDYYNLAEILNVEILSFVRDNRFGYTMTIKSISNDKFPLLFDASLDPVYGSFTFGSESEQFFTCLVQKYKPAYAELIIIAQE